MRKNRPVPGACAGSGYVMGGRMSSPQYGWGQKRGTSARCCPRQRAGVKRASPETQQGTFVTLQWAQAPFEQGQDWQGELSRSCETTPWTRMWLSESTQSVV